MRKPCGTYMCSLFGVLQRGQAQGGARLLCCLVRQCLGTGGWSVPPWPLPMLHEAPMPAHSAAEWSGSPPELGAQFLVEARLQPCRLHDVPWTVAICSPAGTEVQGLLCAEAPVHKRLALAVQDPRKQLVHKSLALAASVQLLVRFRPQVAPRSSPCRHQTKIVAAAAAAQEPGLL